MNIFPEVQCFFNSVPWLSISVLTQTPIPVLSECLCRSVTDPPISCQEKGKPVLWGTADVGPSREIWGPRASCSLEPHPITFHPSYWYFGSRPQSFRLRYNYPSLPPISSAAASDIYKSHRKALPNLMQKPYAESGGSYGKAWANVVLGLYSVVSNRTLLF